ncbi:hypothetical protein LARI1_G004924 [Lachnellula arida]|uniref:Uncharacterized protein n=1 Tax=Lachnellula arida TaxID=1316785 RepID=A0A8T9BBR2_9HELO|nr:hypothetical protein LARI1_G004924 [Lachnellula arida]
MSYSRNHLSATQPKPASCSTCQNYLCPMPLSCSKPSTTAFTLPSTYSKPSSTPPTSYTCTPKPWCHAHGQQDNIGLNYSLGGGCMMMLGTYNFGLMRMVFNAAPEECLACDTHVHADGMHDKCDYDFTAKFRFPNGGIGEGTYVPRPLYLEALHARVTHKETIVLDASLPATEEKTLTREVTLHGFMNAVIWHRIDVTDCFVIRSKADGRPLERWVEWKAHKAYTYRGAGGGFADGPVRIGGCRFGTSWRSFRIRSRAARRSSGSLGR